MYRQYDWECSQCGANSTQLVDVPHKGFPPRLAPFDCDDCGSVGAEHLRLLSMPAPYMGEKPYNPMVTGGAFDTTGNKALPPLPDLPAGVPETTTNYRQLFKTKEFREAKAERKNVQSQNIQKRKRAAAIRSGANINMRNDKCIGDPKITA